MLIVLQSSVAGSAVASSSFSSRGFASTSTQPVPSKPVSLVGSYPTTSGYSGSDAYNTSYSQYGSESYYSSTTTTAASFGRGSYASYQGRGSSGPRAASKQASSYAQPIGRGSYAMAGGDSSYSTYSGSWGSQSGYDSGYNTPAGTDVSAYGAYDESSYYMETDEDQSYAGYGSGGNYGNMDPSQQSYDYSSGYDSGYNSGYGGGSFTTMGYGAVSSATKGYGTAKPSTATSYTTAASIMRTGSSFGRPVASSSSSSSIRPTSSVGGKTASSTDQYFTTAGKVDQYVGYGAGDYWSGEDQSYSYGETESGYGGYYGDSTGEYDDYGSSNQGTGEEWDYPTDETGGNWSYVSNQSHDSSAGYYGSASRGRGGWSAGPSGLGRGTQQLDYSSTQNPPTSGPSALGRGSRQLDYTSTKNPPATRPAVPRSTSAFNIPYGTSPMAAGTGFQASRGGRQPAAGGSSFQRMPQTSTPASTGFRTPSPATVSTAGQGPRFASPYGTPQSSTPYGTASSSQTGSTFSSAATGYSRSWDVGGGSGLKSALVGSATSQRAPRVDGFTSYMSGTVSSTGPTKSAGTALFSEPRSESEKRPSRWSDGKTDTSGTQQDTRRQSTGSSQYSRSSSAQQPSDNGTPRVFDYGHRDCDEQQAARSSARSYYLGSVNTAKPAAAKRASSPSPDYRRPSSSVGSDWQTSSRRDDGRESSRHLTAGRSRDDNRSSSDTYDHRKSSYLEKSSSSSGSDRQDTSYGQGSSAQGRPSQDRWYSTDSGSSSRSLSVGQRTGEPARTVGRTVPSLMDSVYSTSSAKTAPVCVPSLSLFLLFLACQL